MMYLRVPLRGEFQLDCELTTFNWREMRVTYGGMTIGAQVRPQDTSRRWHFSRELPDITLNPPLEPPGDWYKYRLVVKHGLDDRVRQRTADPPGPAARPNATRGWPFTAGSEATGGARNIAITGRPVIPEQLNLSALPDLTGWLADYYGDSVTGDNPTGRSRARRSSADCARTLPGSKQESVLLYHRPMLEDGEITYEFFHEPGKTIAHPALDRLAFLLEPDGVKVHRLTDAQHERTGLSPDNAAVEPENRRGPSSLPLKARDWNKLVLSLAGDKVALRLNGQLIYERAARADQSTFLRPVPLRRRDRGAGQESHLPRRVAAKPARTPRAPAVRTKSRGGAKVNQAGSSVATGWYHGRPRPGPMPSRSPPSPQITQNGSPARPAAVLFRKYWKNF